MMVNNLLAEVSRIYLNSNIFSRNSKYYWTDVPDIPCGSSMSQFTVHYMEPVFKVDMPTKCTPNPSRIDVQHKNIS